MGLTATGKPTATITYTLSETSAGEAASTLSESAVIGDVITYSDGGGTGQVNMGVLATGRLAPNGSIYYDFSAFPKTTFGLTSNLSFESGVKGIVISNTWNGSGGTGYLPTGFPVGQLPYITIAATGVNAFTELFNGGSGGFRLHPKSSWSYTDYAGVFPTASNKVLSITDTSGSGCQFSIGVIGVTG